PLVIEDPTYPAACTRWGEVVAGSAEHIVVGDSLGQQVFVYDRAGQLEQILRPPAPVLDSFSFGIGVAVGGDTVLVRSGAGKDMGIYWFNLTTSHLERVLTSGDEGPNRGPNSFGSQMVVTEDRVIVGDDSIGRVYLYDRATGDLMFATYSPFGFSVHAAFGHG